MKDLVLIAAIIAHFVLVGADIFGQIVISPVVLSAPPASLSIFQGEYAYNSTIFWKPANMIALGLLILSIVANWKSPRRNLLISWFVGSIVVTIVSLSFIFPEYMAIVSTSFTTTIDPELVARGSQWQMIAFFRMCVFLGIGLLPLYALTKHSKKVYL